MNNVPAFNCISSRATSQLLGVLCQQWFAASGQTVQLQSVGGVDAARRIEAGELFDVAVLAAEALEKLAAAGRVQAISAIAVSDVAIAAAPDADQPIDTVAQLLVALHTASGIGYSTGPSGNALLALLAQWGVLESLKPKLVQAPAGVAVGELIAKGTVSLGFQQLSELIHCPGIHLLGSMPMGAEISTVFSAALCVGSSRQPQATAFIQYLCSPACADIIRAEGMAPPPHPSVRI